MTLALSPYELDVATSFGPRITGLRREGGAEIFAVLGPDIVINQPGEPYIYRGGHRVWAAPEIPAVTYAPDGHDCIIGHDGRTITVSAPPDRAGIIKELVISVDGDTLMVENRITFTSALDQDSAPWAITQLPLGGHAILPLTGRDTSPLPNRQLVLWPYTNLDDPRVTFFPDALVVEAGEGIRFKVGAGPAPGRLGYFREGWLFIKEIPAAEGQRAPDFGAVAQVYVGDGFCELESLGGFSGSREGSLAAVIETWRVLACPDLDMARRMIVDGAGT